MSLEPKNKPDLSAYSHDRLNRYRLVEIIALWEGRLTTNHLCQCFDIGRQQASKDINTYLSDIAPGNLEYDLKLKGYRPTSMFRPVLTSGNAEDYLNLLAFNQRLVSKGSHFDWGFDRIASVSSPPRNIKPVILQSLVKAISQQQRLEIEYLSLGNPHPEVRVISPHTLVQTPLRWHVRAYCEKNRDYRDFVISRFSGQPDLIGVSENLQDDDDDWFTPVDIELIPDQRLNEHQQRLVEIDFGMDNGELKLRTSLALLNYDLSMLNLSVYKVDVSPEVQQLSIRNVNGIRRLMMQRNML
ncbi:WYL domain-containing protein [Vibrio agarivorans]|uniref:WYL domain-containing protein n=1 Tax=Vibrio agarivorans TaxID=153622 RepID=UPI00222FD150|nr:WYL domain-containing protein [Vibrio agarivorans]MDN3663046.1 WYL domain-containing protein [Vibrio agarivorans]